MTAPRPPHLPLVASDAGRWGARERCAACGGRTSVESTCSHTLSVLESGVTDAEAEATLGLGQLEEQLLAAKDELNLMVMMGSWKPWEGASRTLKTSLACRLRVPTSTW
jgi:hypothetical protein